MPGVCLPVCLLATLRKNYWTDLQENFTTDVSVHKEELIKFWESSASVSGSRNFKKYSSTLWDGAYLRNLAHISGQSDRILMKISSQMYPWTRQSLLNFGSNPETTLADVCGLWLLLVIMHWLECMVKVRVVNMSWEQLSKFSTHWDSI